MRGWILALARSAWALQGVLAGCWMDSCDWNHRFSTSSWRPRAR
jgi:hypothetical protein